MGLSRSEVVVNDDCGGTAQLISGGVHHGRRLRGERRTMPTTPYVPYRRCCRVVLVVSHWSGLRGSGVTGSALKVAKVLAAQREHCTPDESLALSGDGALCGPDSSALIVSPLPDKVTRRSAVPVTDNPEIYGKARQPVASTSTCENPAATPSGIELGSTRWEASNLTTPPPRPPSPACVLVSQTLLQWLSGKRVRFPAEGRMWESIQTTPLVGVFSRGFPVFSRFCITALLHANLASPPSALEISIGFELAVNGDDKGIWGIVGNREHKLQRKLARARCREFEHNFAEPVRLARSPPAKENRAHSPAGSPDFHKWGSCRAVPLVGGFSRDLPFPPPLHSGTAPYSPQSPSSALKTSLLRADQISSPSLSPNRIHQYLAELPYCRARVFKFFAARRTELLAADLSRSADAEESRQPQRKGEGAGVVPSDADRRAEIVGGDSLPSPLEEGERCHKSSRVSIACILGDHIVPYFADGRAEIVAGNFSCLHPRKTKHVCSPRDRGRDAHPLRYRSLARRPKGLVSPNHFSQRMVHLNGVGFPISVTPQPKFPANLVLPYPRTPPQTPQKAADFMARAEQGQRTIRYRSGAGKERNEANTFPVTRSRNLRHMRKHVCERCFLVFSAYDDRHLPAFLHATQFCMAGCGPQLSRRLAYARKRRVIIGN
ncbi:hypothetical protein PR048_022450 [Dryococelus australis]|uniref:C2H2-type domain-containing protein n=1 Tax=Dryococelus australis TaxID=614101 RepID=A0ABQ9H156_9NEOP|nr:hypothetical protein PR048_022450 [Dryococelus australis]